MEGMKGKDGGSKGERKEGRKQEIDTRINKVKS
jgi:hypothetical protein